MNIALVDADTHNYASLPLMKLSAWHIRQGDHVELWHADGHYDIAYISKVFSASMEVDIGNADEVIRGGSGYNLKKKLPDNIEHTYPDYSLYPAFDSALGFLTRGCPWKTHTFCITPQKDGCKSRKVADIDEFWRGQKLITLLDQNLLACPDRLGLLGQLAQTKAAVNFDGGTDIRFVDRDVLRAFKQINVVDYHYAWDNPKENLYPQFELFAKARLCNLNLVSVYVLTNYWSSIDEDLERIYKLRELGFMPYVMVYDKHEFVDKRGRWLPGVADRYTTEQLYHFKVCQHMQRWCNGRTKPIRYVPDFEDYEQYRKWKSRPRLPA